ncbi:uncharacterized protein LOC119071810 [Bradysia coprophila]|uniref:uncharacterized protein LOC119071810 n=1 Tax=Bradysia coprophila TaxID=38358 RepID=UPI00187DD383|nr:uncharacterized protein LOC119071810 [Bradysia coprophila]XP_037032771.1 uncharacterized protein LOC119071810 [Bradysia coprophila]XP_037032772.1 uncharacterized protein LOC119071810 [Bradysia coprophila]XP_037032773.1 uncharacterized protein LOC119071810 [Bradysia coprophila]
MTTVTSLLLLLLVFASENAARPQHNVNISQTGNVRIATVNGAITCDEMTCPSNSIGCSVSVETTEDMANIETVRKCYDKQRVTTKEEKTTSPNPYPGTVVSSYSDSSNTGVIQHFNYELNGDGNEFSSQLGAINTEFQEWQEKFQKEMEAFNANFHKQMLKNFQSSIPK